MQVLACMLVCMRMCVCVRERECAGICLYIIHYYLASTDNDQLERNMKKGRCVSSCIDKSVINVCVHSAFVSDSGIRWP